MKIPPIIYSIFTAFRRLYWRLIKPRTFGVKALIVHPTDPTKMLLIHHTYGSFNAWNLPGGGFNPKRESADAAVLRELKEELSVTCKSTQEIGTYYTENEGKRDTVYIFVCVPERDKFALNSEVREARWANAGELVDNKDYYRVVRRAAELYIRSSAFPHL